MSTLLERERAFKKAIDLERQLKEIAQSQLTAAQKKIEELEKTNFELDRKLMNETVEHAKEHLKSLEQADEIKVLKAKFEKAVEQRNQAVRAESKYKCGNARSQQDKAELFIELEDNELNSITLESLKGE